MKRGVWAAAILLAAALLSWRAARRSPPVFVYGSEARAKLETLEDILRSRNDNDPRLDRDFLGLSDDAKRLFREKYRALAPERRNERGTIVYLLGKNLQTAEDWSFFRAVAAEPPCLSLADCSKPSGEAGESGDEVTLAYPSLVALRQARRAAEEGASESEARGVLEAAKTSKMKAVVRLAASLEPGFDRKAR
ncbi:MAG: hypothetical protein PHS14_12625 [Elusimicrobia bacterium]|nr:hypothetical protein [Elusimicrobiota bacterium]